MCQILPKRVRAWFCLCSLPPEAIHFGMILIYMLQNAPLDRIKAGQSCSWPVDNAERIRRHLEGYVREHKRKY